MFLRPEHVPFESCEIIPATAVPVTHSVRADERMIGGDLLTECEQWVKPWHVAPDPTCPACQAKLAETAEDVFGEATNAPVVKSPQTWDHDADDLFTYAVKLTRQERLQGLADRGIDTYRDRDELN